MKKTLLTCFALVLALSAGAKVIKLPVGPLRYDHQAYPIVFHLNDYPEFSINDRAQLGVFLCGKELPSQLDDMNGDGVPDELATIVDIEAGKALTLTIKPVRKHRDMQKEVHAEMFVKSKTEQEGYTYHEAEGKQFYIKPVTEQTFYPGEDSYHMMHHHGVAFESALMAYRIYFDKKQTIDVYAKKTPRLELDACKWYPNEEQLADGFGDDILRVSGAIGVGTCKPWNGKKMVHFDSIACRTERIVSQGAVRTICEVEINNWLLPSGERINMVTRYTLYARHRDVMVEVFFSEAVENMVTGVQKIPVYDKAEEPHYLIADNVVGSWGTAWPVNDTIRYPKETLGLGVYVPEPLHRANVQDAQNNLILLNPATYMRYYFTCVSLKENMPPARTEQQFYEYLQEWVNTFEE